MRAVTGRSGWASWASGHLGRHHARLLNTIDGAVLAGVADLSRERAEAAAAVAPQARIVTDAANCSVTWMP